MAKFVMLNKVLSFELSQPLLVWILVFRKFPCLICEGSKNNEWYYKCVHVTGMEKMLSLKNINYLLGIKCKFKRNDCTFISSTLQIT